MTAAITPIGALAEIAVALARCAQPLLAGDTHTQEDDALLLALRLGIDELCMIETTARVKFLRLAADALGALVDDRTAAGDVPLFALVEGACLLRTREGARAQAKLQALETMRMSADLARIAADVRQCFADARR